MSWGEAAVLVAFILCLVIIGIFVGVALMKRTREYRSGEQVLEAIAALENDQQLAAECEQRMHVVAEDYWRRQSS